MIILIGFKQVGKSELGIKLACRLGQSFLDLDGGIEQLFYEETREKKFCRSIYQEYGEDFFRRLEHEALKYMIKKMPAILATGGGTPLRAENQGLMQGHQIVYLTAQPAVLWDRILKSGSPAFFPQKMTFSMFKTLVSERDLVYRQLSTITVNNEGSVESTLEKLIPIIRMKD